MDMRIPPLGAQEGPLFWRLVLAVVAAGVLSWVGDRYHVFAWLIDEPLLLGAVAGVPCVFWACVVAGRYKTRVEREEAKAAVLEQAALVAPFFGGTNSAVNGDVNGGTVVMGRGIDVHWDTPSPSDDEDPDEDDNPDSSGRR